MKALVIGATGAVGRDLVEQLLADGAFGDTTANIVRTMQDTMRAEGLPEASEADIVSTIGVPLEKGFEMLYPEQGFYATWTLRITSPTSWVRTVWKGQVPTL